MNALIMKASRLLVALLMFVSCIQEDFTYEKADFTSPDVDMDIQSFVNSQDSLSILAEALSITGLGTRLSSGIYTLIAPDNVAFRNYLSSTAYKTLDNFPVTELATLMENHIIPDRRLLLFDPVTTEEQQFESLSGKILRIYYNNDLNATRYYRMFVNGIQITTQGWKPTNGVVHVTNRGVIK